ncbi:general substrate transporter [Neohortaea acidophila]|uniref:General substrate transporter n=1 Tax=Neohortaea acidophila TaxID=245834 RepID=A0A6A6Q5Y3_9PEZI|nr:general substrate transporter [Neohortaea acidophila]KAF2487384.1 general substrate transporter [Neohortaea acidophila]
MAKLEGNVLLYNVTLLACLGFLLIGFDNGLMGGLVNGRSFDTTFNLDTSTASGANIVALIVAIYEVGCFFGAIVTAFIGETLGRRRSIFVGTVIMIIGALLQATSYYRSQLIVARIVSGFGMGFINSTVPVLMAEFAPKATRGIFVCAQLSTLNLGIAVVYWIDYAFGTIKSGPSYAWRVPVILQCIFLVLMLIIIAIIPETPRWLVAHNRPDEALEVLRRLNRKKMDDQMIVDIHAGIINAVVVESAAGTGTWKDLLKNDDIQSLRRLLIACSIQAFQQLGGINALIYYSNTIFSQSLKFSPNLSALMSGFLNTWFFIASFIPWFLIDRVGRRPLLLSMVSLMSAVMVVQTGLIYNVQNKTSIAKAAGAGAAAMLFIFEGAFTIGFQAVVWVYPSEVLPLKIRQRGSSISTASNWIMNFLIVYITPPAIQNIGYKTYIIFAVINAVFVPIVYFFYPETKGLALEDVDRLFAKHGGDAERRLSAFANEHHGVEIANGGDIEKPVKYAT